MENKNRIRWCGEEVRNFTPWGISSARIQFLNVFLHSAIWKVLDTVIASVFGSYDVFSEVKRIIEHKVDKE